MEYKEKTTPQYNINLQLKIIYESDVDNSTNILKEKVSQLPHLI